VTKELTPKEFLKKDRKMIVRRLLKTQIKTPARLMIICDFCVAFITFYLDPKFTNDPLRKIPLLHTTEPQQIQEPSTVLMYGFRSELVCLSKLGKLATDNIKDYKICPISAN
jgi:hypothetical protein